MIHYDEVVGTRDHPAAGAASDSLLTYNCGDVESPATA
jgi:hypothetical protein